MKRRQYMYSSAVIPSRTLRRMRANQRHLKSFQTHSAQVNSGKSWCTENNKSSTSSSVDFLVGDISWDHDQNRESSTSTANVAVAGSCNESSCTSNVEPAFTDSSSDGNPEAIDLENETEVPDELWETEDNPNLPSANDYYLSAPLSQWTKATRGDALTMCLALGLRHSLSWTVIVDILKMINSLFGCEVLKATKYFFMKYMEAGKGQVSYHMYCHYCHRYLGKREELSTVTNCHCGKSLTDKKAAQSFFLSLSLEERIKELLSDSFFVDALQHRFERKKIRDDAYEDIFDGELYCKLSCPGGPLSYWYNMSYTFNTDGFPVGGKSGKQTCWPIYVQINEVPPELRSKYMLLVGIYVGRHDPNMQLYLHPFVQEANHLASVGINWMYNSKKINTKVIPLAACVDTPARSKILNMTLFSGAYGCTICPNNPESLAVGVRYTLPLNAGSERTQQEVLDNAAKAHANKLAVRNKSKRRVKGVKGPSPLHNLMFFDVVKGVRPDLMHSILLGNGRHHVSVLHDKPGKPYYIGADVTMQTINNRLMQIRPPSCLPRAPRDLTCFSSWKANEWLAWLLFYVVPCLLGLIPMHYIAHINMLSGALHVFLKKSISPEELEQAHISVLRFVFLFQEYFGKEEMVINIHLLMHMKNTIRFLGPGWTNMAFGFEGANKHLLDLKKGTSSIAQEIATKYLTFKSLPYLCENYAKTDETINFCQSLCGRPLLKKVSEVGDVLCVGKGRLYSLDDEEVSCLSNILVVNQTEVLTFNKFIRNHIVYSTASYCELNRRDDSYVCIRGESKARIQKIVQCVEGYERPLLVFVREILLEDTPMFNDEFGKISPLRKVVGNGKLMVVRPDDISGQCVAMFLETGNFICDIPYGCYGDS